MKKGFTLIELVIVMVVLGILAAIALPKFLDIISDANVAATKAGLGAIRSVVALKYSQNMARGVTTPYSMVITTSDFFDNQIPKNKSNNDATGVVYVTALVTNPVTSATTSGWWVVTTSASTSADAGRAGAYVTTSATPYDNAANW